MSEIPPSQPSYSPAPSAGFDISEWFNIWKKALTHPSAATFEGLERHPQVTMQNSLIWNAISGALGGLLGGLVGVLTQNGTMAGIISGTIFGAIGGLIGLLIYALIVFAISKALGGTGTFPIQVALLGTFVPPLLVISCYWDRSPSWVLLSVWSCRFTRYFFTSWRPKPLECYRGRGGYCRSPAFPGRFMLCNSVCFWRVGRHPWNQRSEWLNSINIYLVAGLTSVRACLVDISSTGSSA
jgi:hypothetical protein